MQYKVIALSVGGKGNRIFHSGDIVTDAHFPPGNAPKLVEQGFLKPLEEEKEEPSNEPKAKSEVSILERIGKSEAKSIGEYTVKELKKELGDKGIEFPNNARKKELYDLLNS